MRMTYKADLASAATVSMSGVALWLHNANAWAADYMPLITAFGIISGACLTAWYYWQSIEQKKRDRDAKYGRREDDPS